ncbi:MAG: TonB-dependent receptor plug domain-containing protein [Roseivirga sp.]|nr:TonB-dependent receptor plug domain-containing protein [Roseivirga sp.]
MRIYVLWFLLCLSYLPLRGQQNLQFSAQSGYSLVYKLSLEEAKSIAHSGTASLSQFNLFNRTPYDTILNNEAGQHARQNGFYLLVKPVKQKLDASLQLVQNLEIKKIPDRKHLRFIILEDGVREVRPTEVSIDGRTIDYDEAIKAYRTKPRRGGSTIEVRHKGEEAIFPVFKNYNPLFYRFGNKILHSSPVKLIYKPGRDIYQSIAYGDPTGIVRKAGSLLFRDLRYANAYGYLLLNKPKYNRGDTLRYKLKLAKQDGRPYNRKVTMSIGGYNGNKFTREVRLKKGQTAGEIVLHDSLNLKLDGYQRLAVMRHADQLISTYFDFEDYSLKSEAYELTLGKEQHGLADGNVITLSGKDENDNQLKNSRYELEVKVASVDKNSVVGSLYIPHVLFKKQGRLEPDKETEIVLADSLFPKANMRYEVTVAFINAANDRIEQSKTASYRYDRPEISLNIEQDSVVFSFPDNYEGNRQLSIKGQSSFGEVKVNNEATSSLKAKLNPSFFYYRVFGADSTLLKSFDMRTIDNGISHRHKRTSDSLKISISNDHSLPMWYTLYREKRKIREGYTESPLNIELRAKNKESYLMSYRYLWAGNISNRSFEMDLYDRALNIEVDQQSLVIPGIKDSLRIRVTDYKGRPVSRVDVASVGITGKFKEDNIPNIPYFGLSGQLRTDNRNFDKPYRNSRKASLNYSRWKKPFRLDTVMYYLLTRPKGLEVMYLDTEDGQTQFAVLSIDKGSVRGISYIKLDDDLVYTYLNNQSEPFSFKASEGFHRIEIRTYSELIQVDSVYFEKGEKTVISIADDFTNQQVSRIDSIQNLRWPLSGAEKNLLAKHTLSVQLPEAQAFSVIQNGRQHDFIPRYLRNGRLGPFMHDSLAVITKDKVYKLLFEPGYVYEFTPDEVFKKNSSGQRFSFGWIDPTRLFDFLPSETVLDSRHIEDERRLTPRPQLELSNLRLSENRGVMSINPFMEKQRYLTHAYVVSDSTRSFALELGADLTAELDSGYYEVFLLYDDSRFTRDRVHIRPGSITITTPEAQDFQSFENLPSILSDLVITNRETVKPNVINIPKPSPNLNGFVSGVVTGADDGLPLPQVTVLFKGTTTGIPTDMDGFFRLLVPNNGGTLVFRYLGYVTQEIELGTESVLNVQLSPDAMSLEEVVVTGYGVASSLQKLSGVTVVESEEIGINGTSGTPIQIRGLSTASSTPLYIVDGVPVNSMDNISEESINDISILKSASAIAIYGTRGANGVVLITTKGPGQQTSIDNINLDIEQEASGNSIRNNFRDYAYWAPSVTTDRNGEATILIQYPDDITSWKHHFLAMSNRGFTGQLKTTTKAFKPLASRLMIPRFLIEGDSAQVYGQISNYTGDSINVSRSFQVADKSVDLGNQLITQGHIDSLTLTASDRDSLDIVYMFSAQSGDDGERRSLPIFKKGIEQTDGSFYHLQRDTSFSISPVEEYSKPTVTIISGLRDLMLKDIQHLQEYAYWCNEQKASKLIALLAEKQLLDKTGEGFRKNGRINRVIKRIRKDRNKDGGWGWWNGMSSAPWVTNHVTRALLLAQLQGFDTKTDLQQSSQNLLDQLAMLRGHKLIESMHVLLDIDSTLNLSQYLAVAQAQSNLTTTDQIKLLHLKYRIEKSLDRTELDAYKKISQKAGVYFMDSTNGFQSNSILATLSAYRLLKEMGGQEAELADIRSCLMLDRQSGQLRNTYEAAKILNTIGPDLDTASLVPNIKLNGSAISAFPYQTTMRDHAPINIELGSNSSAYLTVSQEFQNGNPVSNDSLAVISTYFLDKNGEALESITKGERTTLKVQIEVSEHHSFAMLEVPIPGGCNYYDKPQPYARGQYREYFKDKVNFYFESLEPGKYEFEIPLVNQFSGHYTLNPASLSLMYYPLVRSNNETKQVVIR